MGITASIDTEVKIHQKRDSLLKLIVIMVKFILSFNQTRITKEETIPYSITITEIPTTISTTTLKIVTESCDSEFFFFFTLFYLRW